MNEGDEITARILTADGDLTAITITDIVTSVEGQGEHVLDAIIDAYADEDAEVILSGDIGRDQTQQICHD